MHSILQDKKSEKYTYYANDFQEHRFFQWQSIWYQAREAILDSEVHSVLEFGTGRNVTKAIIEHFGIKHLSVDVNDTQFIPDVCSTIEDFSTDEKFDMVCAFEVLEHNPIEKLPSFLNKFRDLSNKYVYISLPFSGRWISCQLNIFLPGFRLRKSFCFTWERLFKKTQPVEEFKKRENKYAPHWWEVGDKNCSLKRMKEIIKDSNMQISKQFHSPMFPYHIFFLCKK